RRPVPEAPAVVDVEAARWRAPKLVADVLGDDAARDAALPKAPRDALLDEPRELELRQAHVPVGIALHRPERVGIEALDQPLGQEGHAMLPALDATLDDRALEDARDLIEGDRALGKLLTDDGQGRAGGAADAEGQVSRVAAHDGHEEPLVRRRGVLHEIPHEILAYVDRRRVPERRGAG